MGFTRGHSFSHPDHKRHTVWFHLHSRHATLLHLFHMFAELCSLSISHLSRAFLSFFYRSSWSRSWLRLWSRYWLTSWRWLWSWRSLLWWANWYCWHWTRWTYGCITISICRSSLVCWYHCSCILALISTIHLNQFFLNFLFEFLSFLSNISTLKMFFILLLSFQSLLSKFSFSLQKFFSWGSIWGEFKILYNKIDYFFSRLDFLFFLFKL